MDKSKIYLDLSKLSEEQQRKVIALLPPKKWDIQYEIQKVHFILYLDEKKQWWVFGTEIKDKTELIYSQFLDMMGESEEVLQVENDIEKLAEESVNEVTENNGDYLFRDVYKAFFKEGFKKAMEIKSNQ